jgi:hypothetical protein
MFSHPLIRAHFDGQRLEKFWKDTCDGRVDGVPLALTIAMMGWIWDGLKDPASG